MSEKLQKIDPRIEQTIMFIKNSFHDKPHYSFDDWTIMYGHSVNTMKYALQLSDGKALDKTVVAITALLHDIGKTVEADPETLLTQHEALGLEASNTFLEQIDLTDEQRQQIRSFFIGEDDDDPLKQTIKDADYVSFYTYPRLHDAFKAWTDRDNLPEQRERKINKFVKISPEAQALSRNAYEAMKVKWGIT